MSETSEQKVGGKEGRKEGRKEEKVKINKERGGKKTVPRIRMASYVSYKGKIVLAPFCLEGCLKTKGLLASCGGSAKGGG